LHPRESEGEWGDDYCLFWEAERQEHPEKPAFDTQVLRGFFEERRIAASVAAAKAIRAEIAGAPDVGTAFDKAIEAPIPKPAELPPVEEWKAAERTDPPPQF
jgi:hypothetical protein